MQMTSPAPSPQPKVPVPTRRDTLAWLLWGSAAVIGLPIVAAAMKYLTPIPAPRRHNVGAVESLPTIGDGKKEAWKFAHLGDIDVAVASDGKGGVVAYELRCTHANCSLQWRENDRSFHCPCHGGRFDVNGMPIEGPPGQPMKRLNTERHGDDLFVIIGG